MPENGPTLTTRGTPIVFNSSISLRPKTRSRSYLPVFRALDYLPPGDISFADYGRAIIAADQAIYPDRTQEREWVIEEFVKCEIAAGAAALSAETNYVYEPL